MRDLDLDADRPADPPYTPPKVTPIDDGASVARRIAVSLGNPYASVPDCAYRQALVVRSVGKTTVAYVADPELLEEMLVKRWRDFPKSQIDHRVFGPSLGRGLLTAEGEDWKWKRRLAAPTFSPAALKAMTPALTTPFETLAQDWARPSESGAPRDVDAAMVAATLEVIERVLFTDRTEFDLSVVATGTEAILKPMSWVVVGAILNLPEWLPYPGKRAQYRARDEIRAMVLQMVARRRGEVAAGAAPDDLATALLKARDPDTDRPLSDDDMADMLLTLVGAGHETSAHTLSWALYCLAHQPRLQDALAAEAREALSEIGAEAGKGNGAASRLAQVAPERLALTEAVIKETLRLFPVVPMMGRVATQDETWRGERVPAGAMCAVPIYALHRHDLYWERPDEFDVGRWLNQPAPPRTLYMPFGAGPRVCIGMRLAMMEMVLGLAAILARCRVEPGVETDCDPLHRVTLRPRDGLFLNVFPRD